jgi:tetratricopeptide (TPR) repeat protein
MIRDFRKRLEKNPRDLDARFNLALAHKHTGDLDQAREELEQARAQQPDSIDVLLELAKVYRRLKRFADVQATAEAILALDPDHEAAARMLQRAKDQTGGA